ncbi:MAG: 50S ribosomal protein L30 [Xanthomonadales bacterium]|jgi:large subunit ribosomal protein L30|uniref:50S ribosomal protein L30 n=1 Tax=Dokdonella sp. TaxID=2291710 RepID=UPI000959DA04|nr:50S ribosomal protein L30 [Xanthomonadales bacterium]MBP9892905.1 50S ribosomal protein L30 [Planctomycetota bacterium]OJY96571.1 MAG: 50S ribosomal protein L30 [Xanthomonadales bacterium 63-13]HQV48530.1 50S ribosomal protein L30 [Dokdonella sp.]MBK7013278.1 50S ribosomal protein L30 [Xanthomonadales bacterium]
MANSNPKTVRVRLVKSPNSCQGRHRLSVKALGLRKINDVRELKDSPSVRGLINQVSYLVSVENDA